MPVATAIFRQELAAILSYRFSLFLNWLSECFFALGMILFWTKIEVKSYDTKSLLGYFFLSAFLQALFFDGLSKNLSQMIRGGSLSFFLLRPYSFLRMIFFRSLAATFLRFILVCPLVFFFYLFSDGVRAFLQGLSLGTILWFIPGMFLGWFLSWLVRATIGLMAFEMTQTWGPQALFYAIHFAFSGVAYPFDLLPEAMHSFLVWTPFYYMHGFLGLILTDRLTLEETLLGFMRGGFLVVLCFGVLRLKWQMGLRRYEGVGL